MIDPETIAAAAPAVQPHIEEVFVDRAPVPGGAAVRITFGLAGIAERVGMLGGRHSITSVPGHGTIVTIVLPGVRSST